MVKLLLDTAVCANKGLVRGNNEDSYYLNGLLMPLARMDEGTAEERACADALQLYAVCDGMGGEAAGEQASYAAAEALRAYQGELGDTVDNDSLRRFVERASDGVYQRARAAGTRGGCTLALCVWERGTVRTVHVGDSRIYLLRDGELRQLTVDHSEVQRMVSMGVLAPEEARTHPKRHVITQYLGMPADDVKVEASIGQPIACRDGDVLLLCSDGLTDMVEDGDLQRILAKADTARTAAVSLVQLALRNGGRDNVTALCLRVRKRFTALQKALLCGSALAFVASLLLVAECVFRLL